MKKILLLLIGFTMLTGCTLMKGSPSESVKEYLNGYKNLGDQVLNDLDTKVASENLSDQLKVKYKEVLKKQYTNLGYTIEKETIDGDNATVEAKVSVYDLHKVKTTSLEYYNTHQEEFMNNNVYDEEKYNNYFINKMNEATDKVDYTLIFNLTKENDTWVINDVDSVTLEKLHGLYNYNNS